MCTVLVTALEIVINVEISTFHRDVKAKTADDKSEIHCYTIARGSFFPSHPILFSLVEKSFSRKRKPDLFSPFQMWHMNRQGERKIFP